MSGKPRLSFWQIWNMSFGFLGIQFGFSLQNANVSRIFQTLGAHIDDIAILWIAAPVTGLVVQPIIGYMSDNTWNGMGRRRPYFLVGAILATISLFIMPNSPSLWIAAGTLWIMDASFNVSMEPFRAFVGDMLPEEQTTQAFAMQSFFIGVGGVVASALPWMMTNWFGLSNVAEAGVIPDSVLYAFYTGGVVLLLSVLWTVYSTKEYSPEQLESFVQARKKRPDSSTITIKRTTAQYLNGAFIWLSIGILFTFMIYFQQLDKQLYVLSGGLIVFALLQWLASILQKNNRIDNGFYKVVEDLFHMPKIMKQLSLVQFLTWFSLFTMWIYTTPAVADFHYGTRDTSSLAYNQAGDWVGILFATYSGFAALAAFLIPVLAKKLNRRLTHLINLCLGGLGLISFYFIHDPELLVIAMVGVGIAWASILSVPYAILVSAVPPKKIGVYMGIFNFFIVIPQILAASVLGVLMRHIFSDKPIYAIMFGGACMIVAGLAMLWVDSPDNVHSTE